MNKIGKPAGRTPASRYINRDLSWIEFNRRVLEEAQDPVTPLLEKMKFLSIVSTNLDEFTSVRVAGMKDQVKAGYAKKDFSGYLPSGLLRRVKKRTSAIVSEQYRTYRDVCRQLGKAGITFLSYEELSDAQTEAMADYFHHIVFPVLTPMAVDQSRPFPLVHNQSLYLAMVLRQDSEAPVEEPYFAVMQVPSNLTRFISLPARPHSKKREFLLLEELIEHHIGTMFNGYQPVAVHAFRLTRNADLTLNEEGSEDLLEEIEKELRRRRRGAPVRLEVQAGMHPYALECLTEEFEITDDVAEIEGPIDLSFLAKLAASLSGYSQLRFPEPEGVYPQEFAETDDLFEVLRGRDVLLYHPYESFEVVNDFILQAAADPDVLAIKMTLYRVSGNSVLVQALAEAAESGKQVTVVVELRARFDEERNIAWARKLEKAGCHVVYGLVGLKTHAKLTLVVRQEQVGLKRYVHIGTGNYNDMTARFYTDVGLLTCDPGIGEDASSLFNEMTGYSAPREWHAISVAPSDMMGRWFKLIRREAEHARCGRPARIVAKMNALSNQEMVDELYSASQAGVHIDLIVRGVCCLRPGVPGLSETITVRSIVDRFLEHSRICWFANGGDPEVWISSADWMSRNLTRRIELMCPVRDPGVKISLIRILELSLADNCKARKLLPNGSYVREGKDAGEPPFRSQFEAMRIAAWKQEIVQPGRSDSDR